MSNNVDPITGQAIPSDREIKRILSKLPKQQHVHEWHLLKVDDGGDDSYGKVHYVLWACPCGEFKKTQSESTVW